MRLPFTGSSSAISPTAHYTGHVWSRNGLSHPELATLEGRVMFEALRPTMLAVGALTGMTLEGYLLVRHRALDELLRQAIEDEGVTQVLEIACGMSARGWRFASRYPELTYVEADLPAMAARKRAALARIGTLGERHRVVEIDALKHSGDGSLHDVTSGLDPQAGLVIICEGLLGYLATEAVEDLWQRMAAVLSEFRSGQHLSDLHLRGTEARLVVRTFRLGLAAFVRGGVYLHYESPGEAAAALERCGFASVEVLPGDEVVARANGTPRPSGRLSTVIRARAR